MVGPARGSGYDGRALARATACARALRFGDGDQTRLLRTLPGVPGLLWYLLRVPRTAVALSDGPAGQMIAQHLACRRWGLPRFRLAQGVLQLPSDRAAYLRGRRRQAVRTNVRRARELGLRCEREVVE
ncbi:MAG: hypothetical protein ACRDMX_03320, partial [Solirubrobacteraceae bacterium]